jgi:flagellar basal-body rod protein FlgG
MIRALHSSAAGMNSQQMSLDVIANNLANVQTTGFKKSKVEFQDLLYQSSRSAGSVQAGGSQLPTGIEVGHGSQAVATAKIFTTGELLQTGHKFDVAIEGDGFFQVTLPSGDTAYTRDGAFKVNSEGLLVTSDGLQLADQINFPDGTTDVTIAPTGEVSARPGADRELVQIGQLQLHRFRNPAGLDSLGRNLYGQTDASGEAVAGNPGAEGYGSLNQGALEKSNVKVIEEMVNMIIAQRAFEVNSKAIQTADEMMNMTNNLRR